MVIDPEPLGRGFRFGFGLDGFGFGFGFDGPGFASRGFTLRGIGIVLVLMFDLAETECQLLNLGVDLGLGALVENAS